MSTALSMHAGETLPAKVRPEHRERLAVVYVRQSTMQQLERNRESTRLQYGLEEAAIRLGWPRERVLVIDDDLGCSGASAEGRPGFQRLLGEVALDHVGIILGVEMSRLARSCRDWHQLLELCSIFRTLIGDLDGLYDPAQYNDRLLLGLKGTMSEAELHVLKNRMLEGKLAKARRGELGKLLPIGYVRRPSGEVALDPDEEVTATVRLVFDRFETLGTLNAVLRDLVAGGVRIGVRVPGGARKGELDWRRPNRATLYNLLTNPTYAGVYAYGRRPTDPRRKKPGRSGTGRSRASRAEWTALLRDRLPAYISWERYERNLAQLAANSNHAEGMGAVRQGSALLAGILFCGRCGRRMCTQYGGRANRARYSCLRDRIDYGAPACQGLAAKALDAEVERLVLRALEPASLEVSLAVAADLEGERRRAEDLFAKRLERARYEADRAERSYRAVEPENRLVARTLERDWEEKLTAERGSREEHERFLAARPRTLSAEERDAIRALSADLPALWRTETTTEADRKQVIRQVIERVVASVEGDTEWVEVTIQWIGGHRTVTRVRRPVRRLEQLSSLGALRARIVELREAGLTSVAIADRLNEEGWRPAKRRATFSAEMVRSLISRTGLARACRRRAPERPALSVDEAYLADLAHELTIPTVTLYNWVQRGWVRARQLGGRNGLWVIAADASERERLRTLRNRRRSWPDERPPESIPGPIKV